MMKKFVFIACVAMFAVMAHASFVAAQDNEEEMALSPADFGISRVGILPTSNFYFLKELQRNIQRAFAFSAANKAKLEMKIANERAAEIATMKETGAPENSAMERALEEYARAQEKANKALERVKKGKESALREEVLTRAAMHNEKHRAFLQELAQTVKDTGKVKENILRAEEAMRGFTEALLEKAADEIERAQELIEEVEMILVEEEIAQEQACPGDVAIGCSAPEVAVCHNGAWICIGPAQSGRITEKGAELEQQQHLLAQTREHIDRAMAAFDEEKYGEAYGQARAAYVAAEHIRRMAEELKKTRESEEGDEDAKEENEKNEEGRKEGCICAQVYSPVCGENGKTYGNACEAACADADVAYAGECAADTVSKSGESENETRSGAKN